MKADTLEFRVLCSSPHMNSLTEVDLWVVYKWKKFQCMAFCSLPADSINAYKYTY